MLRSELATYAAELLTGQGAEVDLNPTDMITSSVAPCEG